MAYPIIVSPLFGVVFDKLTSLMEKNFHVVCGAEKEMKKLSRTLAAIKDVLIDAEEKQVTDMEVRDWLKVLKDGTYAADDVLDEMENEFKGPEIIKELIEKFAEIGDGRWELNLRMGATEKDVGIWLRRETNHVLLTETPQEVYYGRDEDRENLVRQLLDNHKEEEEDIFVIPIVGIAGLGKTTLVKMVYNDERVAEYFKVRSWVRVSDNFDVKRFIKAIIGSLNPGFASASQDLELEPLQQLLREELGGKRFLLVLDDVREENQEEWRIVKDSLRYGGAKGSAVIVTTRIENIASIVGAIDPYLLSVLFEDDCWSLFEHHAFALDNEEMPNLVAIGKGIVKKCGGLPLAAKFLGGLLRSKHWEIEWLGVKDSETWNSGGHDILSALTLNYNDLPSQFKQCFVYCSIFPKDYVIEKEKLIQLWITNGLVPNRAGRVELEDAGNEIFMVLLSRSFFQDAEKDMDGNIQTCRMSDVVHDLARYMAGDECTCVVDVGSAKKITKRTRHASLNFNNKKSSLVSESIQKSSSYLHSLIALNYQPSSLVPFSENFQYIFSHLMHLRALDLSRTSVEFIPDSIGEMKYLRYLNLSASCIKSLPDSICKLRNIQFLKLSLCLELQSLPRDIRDITSLRHLDIRGCEKLTIRICDLIGTETVNVFIEGMKRGCRIVQLQGPDLGVGGESEITWLEHVRTSSMEEAEGASLMEKTNRCSLELLWLLEELSLSRTPKLERWSSWYSAKMLPRLKTLIVIDCPILIGVPLSPSLQYVIMKNCNETELGSLQHLHFLSSLEVSYFHVSRKFPDGMLQNLGALRNLSISVCNMLVSLPRGFRKLLFLVKLEVIDCPELEFAVEDFQHLYLLQELRLEKLPKLTCFPEGIKHATRLLSLKILHCSEDVRLPDWIGNLLSLQILHIAGCKKQRELPQGMQSLTALRDLRIEGCHVELERRCEKDWGVDWFKISHVPNAFISSALDCSITSSEHELFLDMLSENVSDDDEPALFSKNRTIKGKDLQILKRSQQTTKEYELSVGMLPKDVSDAEVSTLFSKYGTIKELQILKSSQETSKGRAFLNYETEKQAAAALKAINGNHKMKVMGDVIQGGVEYPEREGQPVCQYFLKTGTCKFGPSCKFHHPKYGGGSVSPVSLNYQGYPLRPGENECSYYVKTGRCKFGIICKFHHPQPAGTSVQVPAPAPAPAVAPAIYQTVQSTLVPSTQQYGVSPSWQIPRPPLLTGSYVQGADGHMLLPQGMVTISGWNPYSAPVSPIASPSAQSTVGAGPIYGLTQLSSSAPMYAGPYPPVSPSVNPSSSIKKEGTFPERPGQPECQYYLRTGDCKFGSSCRYHHPPEWTIPSTSCILGPMGLPLRPGAQPCSFYMQHWICKFGPTCKFDHPVGSLSYSPSGSSLVDMPVAPYPILPPLGTSATSSLSSESRIELVTRSSKNPISPQMPTLENTSSSTAGSIYSRSGPIAPTLQLTRRNSSPSSGSSLTGQGSEAHS